MTAATKTLLFYVLLFSATFTSYSQVGIGTSLPATSAKLEISSTTQGFLPPRMTQKQRSEIASPVAGLMIWCTTCGPKGELQIYDGTNWTNTSGIVVDNYTIGAYAHGGVVGHIFVSGESGYIAGETHGLIVSLGDLGYVRWCNTTAAYVPGTLSDIGKGFDNTNLILAQFQGPTGSTQGTVAYAAALARSHTGGGYSDWFLPSLNELQKLCVNKALIGGITTPAYWSSTMQASPNLDPWNVSFNACATSTSGQTNIGSVRAVRRF